MLVPSIFGENLFDDFMTTPWEREFFGGKNPLYGKHQKNIMKTDITKQEKILKMLMKVLDQQVSCVLQNQ